MTVVTPAFKSSTLSSIGWVTASPSPITVSFVFTEDGLVLKLFTRIKLKIFDEVLNFWQYFSSAFFSIQFYQQKKKIETFLFVTTEYIINLKTFFQACKTSVFDSKCTRINYTGKIFYPLIITH